MSQQNEPTPGTPSSLPSRPRRRFLTGVLTGGLLGSLLAGSLNVFSQTPYGPAGWFRGHEAWGQHRHGMHGLDMAGERLAFATDWVLSRIQATAEQRQQVKTIVQDTVSDLGQVKDQHHKNRQAIFELLGQATIDRETLQNVRAAEVQLLETASSRIVEAIADVAETLTPEQRTTLLAFASQCQH